jgi:hypothetical protein
MRIRSSVITYSFPSPDDSFLCLFSDSQAGVPMEAQVTGTKGEDEPEKEKRTVKGQS